MEITRELLDLIFRWVHVVAAIMWIGNSLLFNWLDRNLLPRREAGEGSRGEIWLLHSGGFYEVEKTISPERGLPRPLHWFKWQAYTTWLSGAVLLVLVYYMTGGALLVAPGAALTPAAATALGVGVLVAGLIVYESLWRSPLGRLPIPAALVSFVLLLAVTYGLSQVFTGRATFLHVGALLGTLMAANVANTIMPSQRELVAAVERGDEPNPALSDRAKLRSIHNNYMTFPVIILMLSSHFPTFHGHAQNWLVLGVLVLAGAGVRHMLNVRFEYPRWRPALAALMAAGIALLYLLATRPLAPRAPEHDPIAITPAEPVTFEAVHAVIQKRCTVCHSASPADRTFGIAPGGVAFDTDDQIRALAGRIHVVSVATRTMPPANRTWMTEAERALLDRWAAHQPRGDAAGR